MLDIAEQKRNDAATVSFLAMLFPKTMGHLRLSHMNAFRTQQKKCAEGQQCKLGSGTSKSPTPEALRDIVTCIDAHVGAALEFTTAEICNECLAVLEKRHPMVLVKGFKLSDAWLNSLMRDKMQLPMRRTTTSSVPAPLTDEAVRQHRIVLLRIAYVADYYDIPQSMVVSRDQSGLNIYPRRGVRRAARGSTHVPAHGHDDKRMVTIDYAISASGVALNPQVVVKGQQEHALGGHTVPNLGHCAPHIVP